MPMHHRQQSAARSGPLAHRVRPTRWWSRWSRPAAMTCRGPLSHWPEAADDQPHLPIVVVVVGGDSPPSLAGENFLSTSCRKTRFVRSGMPAGMRAGAVSPRQQAESPGLTVKLPSESSLRHWPRALVGSPSQSPMTSWLATTYRFWRPGSRPALERVLMRRLGIWASQSSRRRPGLDSYTRASWAAYTWALE